MQSFLSQFNLNLPLWLQIISACLTSFIITYYAIPTIVKISKVKNLYDFPNSRKMHSKPIPALGGLAVFAGFTLSLVIFCIQGDCISLIYMFGGLVTLLIIGVKDDILIIHPKKKLMGLFLASVIVVFFGDMRINNFYGIFGVESLQYSLSIIFTVLLLVFYIITFNFIDGIDGLAAGIGLFSSVFYGIWFYITDNLTQSLMAFSFASALLAFLRFNVFGKENKIFLGDTGAIITGFISGILTIEFIELNSYAPIKYSFKYAPFVSLGLFFVPFLDAIRIIAIRFYKKSPFKPGMNHIHHIISSFGFSHLLTSIIIISINVIILITFVIFQSSGNNFLLAYAGFLFLSFFLIVQYLNLRKNKKF